MSSSQKALGIVAQFDNPAELLRAARQTRIAGYTRFDCHSPFPIHGMDEAMRLKRSPIGWIVGLSALLGSSGMLALIWWTEAVNFPRVISGKPFFSFQAFIPIVFALGVLSSGFAALFGMFVLNRLPRLHHPLFYSERFKEVSVGGFFVSIESDDPRFDEEICRTFLESIGGRNVEVLRGE